MSSVKDLARNKTDLGGFHMERGYRVCIFQRRVMNGYYLLWPDGNQVVSLSQSRIRRIARATTKPAEENNGRWRTKIEEILVLVTPDGSIFRDLTELTDDKSVVPLQNNDSRKIEWETDPF